ncbi:UPF0481 protein At3g47200 [Oryza sativa Japonica Group]|uniref:UPF0481 protein At3g47200 n=1 Tax=Oryza sativa subsp. japonica TaxID=39947 RepID=UPI000E1BEF59|nr:UPF0481 protein At3g47200-like [Oryza sativa Japonica Group]
MASFLVAWGLATRQPLFVTVPLGCHAVAYSGKQQDLFKLCSAGHLWQAHDLCQSTIAMEVPEIAVEVAPEIIIAVEMPEAINTTIVRLPMYMQEANKGLFKPRVVSIGPYHYGQGSTLDMETHKDRFHHAFFQRLGNHVNHQDLIAQCTEGAMQCYNGNVDFRLYTLEKLMHDGCFILELLIQWEEGEHAHVDDHMRLMSNSIYYDLLIVDNQVPFFVLARLFEEFRRYNGEHPIVLVNTPLVNLISNFFNYDGQFSWVHSNLLNEDLPNANHRHLLEIQYNLVIRRNNNRNNNDEQMHYYSCLCGLCSRNICHKSPMPLGIPGANELQDYGVKFHQKENHRITDIFDVTFSHKTMSIPQFKINFGSKILLANLFAYDQIAGQQGRNNNGVVVGPVTSYVALMNALINTKKDVMVLQREGILDNLLSNEEEVASFFNRLGRCALVDVSNHRYTGMFEDVNRYWRYGCCCKHFVTFRMKHCRNPWTCLSLMGAILLLFISLISMIYTILQYYNRRQ